MSLTTATSEGVVDFRLFLRQVKARARKSTALSGYQEGSGKQEKGGLGLKLMGELLNQVGARCGFARPR